MSKHNIQAGDVLYMGQICPVTAGLSYGLIPCHLVTAFRSFQQNLA